MHRAVLWFSEEDEGQEPQSGRNSLQLDQQISGLAGLQGQRKRDQNGESEWPETRQKEGMGIPEGCVLPPLLHAQDTWTSCMCVCHPSSSDWQTLLKATCHCLLFSPGSPSPTRRPRSPSPAIHITKAHFRHSLTVSLSISVFVKVKNSVNSTLQAPQR